MDVFSKYMEKLEKGSSKVMIYHDTDADGICSAVLINKYLERLGQHDNYFIPHNDGPRRVSDYMLTHIEKINPDYLIILDLAFDEDIDSLLSVKNKYEFESILVIDHHKITKDVESYKDKKLYVIKPQLFTSIPPEKYPTSKLTYDLIRSLWEGVENYWWIASLGIIGDSAFDMWSETFIKPHLKKENISLEELFYAEELISYALMVSDDMVYEVREVIDRALSIKDVIESLKKYEYVKKTIDMLVEEHTHKAEIIPSLKLLIYEINPKDVGLNGVRSRVATILSQKYYPDYTIIVYGKDALNEEKYVMSLRNASSKVDVAKMIHDLKPHLTTLDGGGHKPAAGAVIGVEELERFKALVKEYVGSKQIL